jgi:thiamine kinase-like enzyme
MVFSNQNFLVSKYCPGDMPTLMDLAEIGSLFADIHSLNVSVPPIDLLTHLEAYQFQVRDMQITPDRDVADCYSRVMAMPKPKITTRVLCHQDLTLSNMIKTNSGIVAIDWEYARQSDPAYDLAVFTYTHELTQKQFSDLLNSYARHEAELPQRVDYFQRVYAMIEIFWSLIRGGEINTGKLRALLDSA